MTYDKPPIFVPATPEYILDVIRDSHRQQCGYDPEADPAADLTFDTTIDEWREACDLFPAGKLGEYLNYEWGLEHSDSAWREVLEPSPPRNLRDLCQFIASSANRPVIEPVTILRSACLPAGAFLAIRSILRDNGANVDGLRPSTPLGDYARRFGWVFVGPISRLAPNSLPRVRVHVPWYNLATLILALGFLGLLIAPLACLFLSLKGGAAAWMILTPFGLVVSSLACMELVSRFPPSRVEFGSLRTFRDLATAIADGACERH